MAYTNRESEVYGMHVVVLRCPHALRWLLRVAFKVGKNFVIPAAWQGLFFCPFAYRCTRQSTKHVKERGYQTWN